MEKKEVPEGIMVIEHKKPKGILGKIRENVKQELKFREDRKKTFKSSFREASLKEARKAGKRKARAQYTKKPGKSLLGSLRSDAGKLGAVQMVYGKPNVKTKKAKRKKNKQKYAVVGGVAYPIVESTKTRKKTKKKPKKKPKKKKGPYSQYSVW